MRKEYDVYIRLCFDKEFLNQFLLDRYSTLYKHYKDDNIDYELFLNKYATDYGIQEEYYKRLSMLLKTSSEIFRECHALILTYYGNNFFEKILSNFFNFFTKPSSQSGNIEILDPFDGYVIGPHIMEAASKWYIEDNWWLYPLLRYKWALWHANRVRLGFPPLYKYKNLVEGATIVEAKYELKLLLREVIRLNNLSVTDEVYKARIRPKVGNFYCLIMPDEKGVVEAKLNEEQFHQLKSIIDVDFFDKSSFDKDYKQLSNVINNSFLCCSNELCDGEMIEKELSKHVIPLPH
jgi:hypothetical protein